MLALQQAYEVKESILAYLKATFSFKDKATHQAFYQFLNHPREGIFKGPYISLKLPFVKANQEEKDSIPLEIKPAWDPYDHQVKAFHRLHTQNEHPPQPTIITTGTSSGKTESFLFPVLDYCYKNRHRPGIKVIILYPMNALATDQAKRLASAIDEDDRLKGNVTAGLFIGEGRNAKKYPKSMGKENIIENRETIVDSAPDILLTNFKMLDYGLMRNNFHNLWNYNLLDSSLLKFMILDELHTYDGAQGTDVANLIRRLKLKLKVPPEQLCPVGTSATIGSGEESFQLLAEYASTVFGEKITPDCIISENRVSLPEFFNDKDRSELYDLWIGTSSLRNSVLKANDNYDAYLQRQYKLWGIDEAIDPISLGELIKNKQIIYDLLSLFEDGKYRTIQEVSRQLSLINKDFKKLSEWDEQGQFNQKEAVIQSLIALIAEAKINPARHFPLIYVQVHLWLRELSGLLRELYPAPKFTWKDQINSEQEDIKALPPYFCRDCGANGWIGVKHDNKNRLEDDTNDIYTKFFGNHKHIYFINYNIEANSPIEEYEPSERFNKFIGIKSLEFHKHESANTIYVTGVKKLDNKGRNDHVCPECNSRNTINIIGTRIATLSSVAVSQVLATDLNSQPEQERKILAFTNSVQDAAHQAGFVEARNYRFTFRSSMQKIITSQPEPMALPDLYQKFIDYWKNQADDSGKEHLDAYYHRFFPSDYIGKASPLDYKTGKKYSKDFQKEFDERVKWEIYSEFGYNSLIGRTLEKTGSAAVLFDREKLNHVWQKFQPWLEANNLSVINEQDFLSFLNLLLHRIRSRGGVDHPYLNKFRSKDLKMWDLNWMKDERHFLNRRFGPKTRIPRLVTTVKETRGLLDPTFTSNINWFHGYYRKCFTMATTYHDLVNDFFQKLFGILEEQKIVNEAITKDIPNFAIVPEFIKIDQQVKQYECKKCGHVLSVAGKDQLTEGGVCLTYRCNGSYQESKDQNHLDYYQLVYNRKRSPRIYAADHTGLLDRKDRELKEADFKNRTKFNSLNALVATSTLEMGINIGTLNTAINNSVPPLPSNFLQRIGRAGRDSGSALILNFAQSQAHDLFYYEEPKDMMEGEINTPGCYLDAKEILKRHFFAFTLDSWVLQDVQANAIPQFIRDLKLSSADLDNPQFFINRITTYIKLNEENLIDQFTHIYQKEVKPEVLHELKNNLVNDQFYQLIKSVFRKVQHEILYLLEKRKDIDEYIKEHKLGEEDSETKSLRNEQKSLWGIYKSIEKRSVLEHMTNVGVLPNYAFPETGVTLNAKVLGNKAVGSSKPPLNKDFEIIRSAKQAIREFAPDNYFYSQGFRLKITGINTFDWSDQQTFNQYRFCSNCDHLAPKTAEISIPKCPKCGHDSWGATTNVKNLARLNSVKSFNNQADASLSDTSDDRDSFHYIISRHFHFHPDSVHGAWAMKKIPFGIEYVKQVQIFDLNLGRNDVIDARKVIINDNEVPAHGFITCRFCGKSSSAIIQKDYKLHYGFCRKKDAEYQGKSDEIFEEIFLFRTILTEALKILLPVQEFESAAEIKMFKAGIELGLRKYYRGNPQHIDISEYKEYNHKTLKFDRYLVLYDIVPGGTGYLEKLFDPREFTNLLNETYKAIKECKCQHQGKDGCYRCIYSYGNQYYQKELSREKAEKRFRQIIDQAEAWDRLTSGLGTVTNTGQIEESELEERFIRSLKNLARNNEEWYFHADNEDGIVCYDFGYKQNNLEIQYKIRPQIDLGPNDGIKYQTRSDFLFICTYLKINNEEVSLEAIPRLAIYLDGYQYHASAENNHFDKDLQKRLAIIESGSHLTWILTWKDMDQFDQDQEDSLAQKLNENGFSKTKNSLLKAFKRKNDSSFAKNSMNRLLEFIKYPKGNHHRSQLALYLSFFQRDLFTPSYPAEKLLKASNLKNDLWQEKFIDSFDKLKTGWFTFQGFEDFNLFRQRILININFPAPKMKAMYAIADTSNIDKAEWQKFWTLFNITQFFEQSISISADAGGATEEKSSEPAYQLEEILTYFEPQYHDIIQSIYEKGMPFDPDQDYCLTDHNGKLIAEAVLVLHAKKIAIDPLEEESVKVFESNGYQVYKLQDFDPEIL